MSDIAISQLTAVEEPTSMALEEGSTFESYSEDAATFEACRSQSLQALERFTSDRAEAALAGEPSRWFDVAADIIAGLNVDEDNTDDFGDEEFEEEEAADEDYADDDDDEPWALDALLRRRVCKDTHEYQYLCQWKHHVSPPTWEGATVLEDEGYLGAMKAFDAAKAEANMPADRTGRRRTRRPVPAKIPAKTAEEEAILLAMQMASEEKELLRKANAPIDHYPADLYLSLVPSPAILEAAVGLDKGIATLFMAFADAQLQITSYASVAMSYLLDRFMKTWEERKATHRPMILYHGTDPRNIPSIVEKGLLVPGTHRCVAVSNGSVYGVGIYTAFKPSTPAEFCRMRYPSRLSNEMFVCVGLVSNTHPDTIRVVKNRKGERIYVVYFDSQLVVPLWLVGFKFTNTETALEAPPLPPAKVQKSTFYGRFDQTPTLLPQLRILNQRPGDMSEKAQLEANEAILNQARGASSGLVPEGYSGRPMTKKMLKEAPRRVKVSYKEGQLQQKKGRQ